MKLLFSLIIVIISLFSFCGNGQAEPDVSAHQAVLIEQDTGKILFEKQAFEERPTASITKIMTALLAIESGKMEEKTVVSRKAIYTGGSSIYLEQGEKIKINDLVYGLMLRSGNDAAIAIAEHIGGSEGGFSFLMNDKAAWLGMTNTNFSNPHGLDAEDHYSSAFDMAILTRYAMQNEIFREISRSKTFLSNNRSYSWQNKHRLVTGYYPYATGGKTGFTKRTGRTLVTTAEKDGISLTAVTLNAPNDWNDHIQLMEWGFDNIKQETNKTEETVKKLEMHQQGRENHINDSSSRLFSFMTDIFRRTTGLKLW